MRRGWVIVFALLAILAFFFPVLAENTTHVITIDPIGNHTAGEVFFIRGTTNLPVNDSLVLEISPDDFTPAGTRGFGFQATVPVRPGENGVNTWSATISTTGGWLNAGRHAQGTDYGAPLPGTYEVFIRSTDLNVSGFQFFDLFPAGTVVATPASTRIPAADTGTLPVVPSPAPLPATSPAAKSAPLAEILPLLAIATTAVLKTGALKKR